LPAGVAFGEISSIVQSVNEIDVVTVIGERVGVLSGIVALATAVAGAVVVLIGDGGAVGGANMAQATPP
jgi:hypothetical protein